MPHTKLPFEFEADKADNNPEIVVNLRLADADRYQLVFASQLYGTFYCVFAKLNIEDDVLQSMQLSLVNYKGQMNLGLLPETTSSWKTGEEGWEFTLHVKGNAGKHHYNGEDDIFVDCKNTPISALDGLVVRRLLHPLHDSNTSLIGQLSKGVFDSEFYERDGAFVANRYHLDQQYKDYKAKNIGIPHMALRVEGVCNTTYVEIV